MEIFDINNPPNLPDPINMNLDKPIPFDDFDPGEKGVSHAPLDLGGTSPVQIPRVEMPKPAVNKPAVNKPTVKIASTDRIAAVKTFFTKLHPGALNFLDEQITRWLTDNPGIRIKRTNVATGDIQGKKSEPNIIITVWY